MTQPIDIIEQIPELPGAYGLALRLPDPLILEIGKFDRVELKTGLYFYGGSANGPGGLKARISRHIRPKRTRHWHIDHITEAGKFVAIGVAENGSECNFVDQALAMNGAAVPLPGFGSSDCSRCRSHLVKLKSAGDLANIFELVKATQQWPLA